MKALGNYRTLPSQSSVERRVGTLISYEGTRASVRFLDGQAMAFPYELFRAVGLREGERFVLVTLYDRRRVSGVRVERTDARVASPMHPPRPMPKVMVRSGMKVVTRR